MRITQRDGSPCVKASLNAENRPYVFRRSFAVTLDNKVILIPGLALGQCIGDEGFLVLGDRKLGVVGNLQGRLLGLAVPGILGIGIDLRDLPAGPGLQIDREADLLALKGLKDATSLLLSRQLDLATVDGQALVLL